MIELGKTQALRVLRIKDVGVYLGEPGNEKVSVLLPKRQVPEGTKIGNMLDVFIYRDSEDRLIATRMGVPSANASGSVIFPGAPLISSLAPSAP